MKSGLIFITLLLYSIFSYSQLQKDSLKKVVKERIKNINEKHEADPYYSEEELQNEYLSENRTFQSLAQPSENNDLANHFKIYLDPKLLKKIDFTALRTFHYNKGISNKNYSYTIRLTFEINKKNEAYNFKVNTGNKQLDKEIIEVFKKYPLEKWQLDESAKLGKISIQLFAREDKKVIIKTSTTAVIDHLPVLKGCEKVEYHEQLSRCLYDQLFKYILANISLKTISKQDIKGEIHIRLRFSIDTNGKIFRVNSIAPNKIIKDEIDRIIELYDQVLVPGKRNNIPKITYCDNYRMLIIENIK